MSKARGIILEIKGQSEGKQAAMMMMPLSRTVQMPSFTDAPISVSVRPGCINTPYVWQVINNIQVGSAMALSSKNVVMRRILATVPLFFVRK